MKSSFSLVVNARFTDKSLKFLFIKLFIYVLYEFNFNNIRCI